MNRHLRSRTAVSVVAGASALALMLAGCGGRGGNSGRSGDAAERSAAAPASPTRRSRSASPPRSAAPPRDRAPARSPASRRTSARRTPTGGVKFGDGKTRKVEIKALDDAYDPQKAKANYDQLKDNVFAMTAGLGHADQPRLARGGDRRRGAAGAGHDRRPDLQRHQAEPLAARLRADLPERGRGLRQAAGHVDRARTRSRSCRRTTTTARATSRASSRPSRARTTSRSSRSSPTRRPTPRSTRRSPSSPPAAPTSSSTRCRSPRSMISSLQKAQQLGLEAELVPALEHVEPGGDPRSPAAPRRTPASTPSRSRRRRPARRSPQDPDVVEYLAALKQYGDYPDPPAFPHCQWSWMVGATLEQAFQKMTEPTRDSFMKALRAIKDFEAPLMLPGTVGGHHPGRSARGVDGGRAEVQRQGLRHGHRLQVTRLSV